MKIELERPVLSRDGNQIGQVERVILDRETMDVREFIIKEGMLLRTDRVVDVELVERIDDDGIHIAIDSDNAETLPAFVEERYVAPGDEDLQTMPHMWVGMAGGHGGGPLFWAPAGPGRGEPGSGSFFEPASANPPTKVPAGSVRDQDVVLEHGTNVIDRNGDSLGTVDEILYDGSGHLSGFRVSAGTIFTHDVVIGMNMIDQIRSDEVQLSVTAEEAESAGATG